MSEIKIVPLYPWQQQALNSPYDHTCMFGGIATSKTHTGAHYVIKQVLERPEIPGFLGANNYDQLSTATLKELFFWLDEYGFQYLSDRKPPPEWKAMKLKTYRNTIHILSPTTNQATTIFTRVLTGADKLRGMEFGWYWFDETRDTDEYAHDMVLGRMRGYDYSNGLVTTTTNGEDWVLKRFSPRPGDMTYGTLHVPTTDSLKAGLINQKYFDTLLKTYTPLMAEQELYAKHVNVLGGRAYYAADDRNKSVAAPWGGRYPDEGRPLIVGCDFNFQPSPCVWMVGQMSPEGNRIHWFREIAHVETSTEDMTIALISQFPGFFYRIYGDASGNRGTTSNAGINDYNQISNVLSSHGCLFTIDVDQANPLVKNRVENMNGIFRNAMGDIRQTYNPQECPLFDGDIRAVGWRKNIQKGQGKLEAGGDPQRTHATDGAGYAVYKLFPPGHRGRIIDSMPSNIRESDFQVSGVFDRYQ